MTVGLSWVGLPKSGPEKDLLHFSSLPLFSCWELSRTVTVLSSIKHLFVAPPQDPIPWHQTEQNRCGVERIHPFVCVHFSTCNGIEWIEPPSPISSSAQSGINKFLRFWTPGLCLSTISSVKHPWALPTRISPRELWGKLMMDWELDVLIEL